ncbi:MAG TPA: hypothetical protein VGD26_06225 [Chitinophagaceae bacterium]
MQQVSFIRTCSLLVIMLMMGTMGYGQIDWTKDTVTETAAIAARFRMNNDLNAAGRKSTQFISMNVVKLKEVVDACAAAGISDLKFWLTAIRREDVAQYALRHPNLTESQKNDLVGRQILVIKVPRSIFKSPMQQGSGFIHGLSPLMLGLLGSGFIPLDLKDLAAAGDTYLSFGTICPPPDSCPD